jgi:hypothetical protein
MLTKEELKDAHLKYVWQRNNAKRRNIDFPITFDEWLSIWLASGHWHQRGIKSADNYVMSRLGDTGPYSVDNVVIKSNRDNVLEGNVGVKKPGNALVFTCLHCKYPAHANNREKHWAGQRCRQKKAPRRMLS